ncbi:uncharacterized protein LOC112454363 [Temnothorax curvispinosus]|uniref:Uncharacterized protein LOC112454363 n=1 Tax=Temnothorax curvispinosus TaxID=300111 RepID=A0A6J1PQZ7_9HYME|nr:uncharacterized protein LOC112454363 [Temnothorax curvispinosus]
MKITMVFMVLAIVVCAMVQESEQVFWYVAPMSMDSPNESSDQPKNGLDQWSDMNDSRMNDSRMDHSEIDHSRMNHQKERIIPNRFQDQPLRRLQHPQVQI